MHLAKTWPLQHVDDEDSPQGMPLVGMQVVLHGGSLMHSKESCSLSATTLAPSLFSILCPVGRSIKLALKTSSCAV